uniref:Uncharacterized protein n=1 Tax=Siphoviridae sp. ct3z32 TaxID=2825327 RepID=A0A8S5VHS7_9CAUD|nr:MAG TPA: hypothetical protein [Siphoviridae sp. ct3z32]
MIVHQFIILKNQRGIPITWNVPSFGIYLV